MLNLNSLTTTAACTLRNAVCVLAAVCTALVLAGSPAQAAPSQGGAAPTEVQTFPVLKGADHTAHGSRRYTVGVRPQGDTGRHNNAYVYRSVNDIVSNPGDCLNEPDGNGYDGCGRDTQHDDNGNKDRMSAANHWASFGYENGTVEVVIKAYWGDPTGFEILPKDAPIASHELIGNELRLTLTQPSNDQWSRQFMVQFEGRNYNEHPLFVFADPLFDGCPAGSVEAGQTFRRSGNNVTVGRPGQVIDLEWDQSNELWSNAQVCIPGGAYVTGSLEAARVDGVRIFGRGILSGIDKAHSNLPNWNGQLIKMGGGSSNITISGITLTDGPRAMLESYGQTEVSNVKVMGWHVNTDGITVGRDSTVSDVFVKVNDDSVKLTSSDLRVERIVAWQQPAGAVLQMGWGNSSNVEGPTVDKLRLLRVDINPNVDRQDLNGAILSLRNMMGTTISDVRISDVEAYEDPYQIVSLRLNDQLVYDDQSRARRDCDPAPNSFVSCDVFDGNGVAQVIILENVTVPGQLVSSIIDENGDEYRGDQHQGDQTYLNAPDEIRNVQFRNVVVGGKKLVHWNSSNPNHVSVLDHLDVVQPGEIPIGSSKGVLAY